MPRTIEELRKYLDDLNRLDDEQKKTVKDILTKSLIKQDAEDVIDIIRIGISAYSGGIWNLIIEVGKAIFSKVSAKKR
jgi:hypothetical protein